MYVVAKQVTINSIFFFSPFFSNIRWTSWAFSVSHWTLPRPGLRLSGDRAGWKGGLGRNVTSSYSWGSNMWWRVCCVLSLGRGGLGKRNRMREKTTMFALPFQPSTPNNKDLVQYSFLFQSSRKPRNGWKYGYFKASWYKSNREQTKISMKFGFIS